MICVGVGAEVVVPFDDDVDGGTAEVSTEGTESEVCGVGLDVAGVVVGSKKSTGKPDELPPKCGIHVYVKLDKSKIYLTDEPKDSCCLVCAGRSYPWGWRIVVPRGLTYHDAPVDDDKSPGQCVAARVPNEEDRRKCVLVISHRVLLSKSSNSIWSSSFPP